MHTHKFPVEHPFISDEDACDCMILFVLWFIYLLIINCICLFINDKIIKHFNIKKFVLMLL